MEVFQLIEAKAELTHSRHAPEAIILSTRIRLARNLLDYSFPAWAGESKRKEVLKSVEEAVLKVDGMEDAHVLECDSLNDLEKQVLVERHLISPELTTLPAGSGVIISQNQGTAIMVNEEDHLRIQTVRNGYRMRNAWKRINKLDSDIENNLDYAFSEEFGFLTACPTNVGTAMRASVMMHLPGLVISKQMEKVIRAVNQLGLAVRGFYGEGSDATGSIFQISNQHTLGNSEAGIIKRISGVLETVIEQEQNARQVLVEKESEKILDKVARSYGILCYGHFINSVEAMNLLSLMRLGIDMGVFPERHRRLVDRLFIVSQPGHMQMMSQKLTRPDHRDALRAEYFREKFKSIPEPDFSNLSA